VNDQELTERIVYQAQQYRMPPEEFVRRIQEAGQLGAIYADVRRSKALIAAVRAATVTDSSGNPVDLSELLGDDEAPGDGIEVTEVPAPDDAAAEIGDETGDEATDGPAAADGDETGAADATEEKAPTA
jgi:trigger factor